MEAIIRKYFQAWIRADIEPLYEIFSENVVYRECYGPEYHGRAQIIRWFEDWNTRGRVLEWTIKRVIEQDQSLVLEWYFKYVYDGITDAFDGVTIADFDNDNRIVKLCEYQSKAEHCFPYGE